MSFSYDTKCELCSQNPKKPCCKVAQLYGMVLFAQNIGSDLLKMSTENVLIVNLINDLAQDALGIYFNVDETFNSYTLTLSGDRLRQLYDRLYMEVNRKLQLTVSGALTENDCCSEHFLRGAFLLGGYASPPQDSYHLEISTPYYTLAKSMRDFMIRHQYPARIVVRKSNYVVYLKDSEQIERFLYKIGARKAAFSLVDVKIQKEMNNYSNRINNTKIYNLEKTLDRSIEQVKAIQRIADVIGLDALDQDLASAARLRLENPDKSLNELVQIGGQFSRSGLNRKLHKLMEIASKLGE